MTTHDTLKGRHMPITKLQTWTREHLEEILCDVAMLVGHESPSNRADLLDQAADVIDSWMRERLGEPSRATRHRRAEHGDVLDLTYGDPDAPTILLVGHYDTVWPAGTIDQWPFSVREDGTATGPGAYDMKAGIVTGVWALRALCELGLEHPTVRFVLNGDEELGSPTSRSVIEDAARGSTASLVLEPGVGWDVKIERKGIGIFTVTAHGIEAHAGNEPLAGASAIHALTELLARLVGQQAPDRGTTLNVGVITGGTARNVVAGLASCLVDVRVTTRAEADRIDRALAELRPDAPRVRVEVEGGWHRPPMQLSAASRELWDLANDVATTVRGPLEGISVGGGSDANFIAALGLPVLDGLGASGGGPHSRHEHVLISDIPDRVTLVAGILHRTAQSDCSGLTSRFTQNTSSVQRSAIRRNK
jgi:glutamate carboxypeptidase